MCELCFYMLYLTKPIPRHLCVLPQIVANALGRLLFYRKVSEAKK